MIIPTEPTGTLEEAKEAIETLEALGKQKLSHLLAESDNYLDSVVEEISAPEFAEAIGYEDGPLYVANILLDLSLEAVTDELELREVSVTPEVQAFLDGLEQRLTAVLTA